MPAHRTRKRTLESGVEMDMTPMIDIVFLLIAFFMIVSDLSNLNIQPVILPEADQAKVPKPSPKDRTVIINVVLTDAELGKSEVRYMGQKKGVDAKALAVILKAEAEAYGEYEDNPNQKGKKDSLLQVLVRCDEGANAGTIHTVYKACQEASIYKVRVAALSDRAGSNPYLER